MPVAISLAVTTLLSIVCGKRTSTKMSGMAHVSPFIFCHTWLSTADLLHHEQPPGGFLPQRAMFVKPTESFPHLPKVTFIDVPSRPFTRTPHPGTPVVSSVMV